MTETFYDVLGVSTDATPGEIRSAYRERLKESHPDLNEDEDAGATTRRIIRARDVLTDADERERYDRIGHDAYVGDAEDTVDDGDVSSAAAAAREAGWAERDASTDDRSGSSREGSRRRARDRRHRERTASERVSETAGTGQTGDFTSTGNPREEQRADAASTDGGTAASATSTGDATANGTGHVWNQGQGFSVRQQHDGGLHRSRLFPTSQSLSILGMTFLLYPVMVFSTVFPPFPLAVNLIVGLCTIVIIGYLQSMPEVGVVVFGVWSLLTPVVFVLLGLELVSLVGIIALTGTWLPLGLSILTLSLVRP